MFILVLLPKGESQEIFIFFCKGMLEKRNPISKMDMNNPESCLLTSSANLKLFLMVNLLVVIGSKTGTKCLVIS